MCESGPYDVKTCQTAVDNGCSFEIHKHGSRNTIYMPETGRCKDIRETMSILISTILKYFYILIFLAEIFWLQL